MSTDWNAAKNEYVVTNCTYQDIADKYGTSLRTVIRQAQKGSWQEARKEYVTRVTEKCLKMSSEKQAKSFTDFIPVLQNGIIDTTTMLLGKIMETMSYGDAFSPRDLKSLSGMVNDLGFLLKDLKEDMNASAGETDKVTVEFVKPYWETE